MNRQIFIGSSGEKLGVLDTVAQMLQPGGTIIKWTHSFAVNKSNLDSLIQQTRLSDYSILIAGMDDLTATRGQLKSVARDNMIFEFGLFLGASGLRKSFLLVEEGVDLPSDLDGITVHRYTEAHGKYNSLDKICAKILHTIQSDHTLGELGLLPSTALAIGYFNSFIKPACIALHEQKCVYQESQKISFNEFRIHVAVPSQLDGDGIGGISSFYTKEQQLTKAIAKNNNHATRDYPFHMKVAASADAIDCCDIHDLPTTLNTIKECVSLFLPTDRAVTDADHDRLERRELDNFCNVVKSLVAKHKVTAQNVVITRI